MPIDNILQRLAEEQIVVPYLENAFHAEQWPDEYTVHVDSRPYYGLTDIDGVAQNVGSGDGYFHPSSHALMSERELYYRFHPAHARTIPAERRTLAGHLALAMGEAAHAVVQTQLHMAGILHKETDRVDEWYEVVPGVFARWPEHNPFEWEYRNERHKLRGRADGVIVHPRYGKIMFEFKTMNSRKYRFLDAALPQWEAQTMIAADQYGVDESVIVVLEMGYPFDVKEYRVPRRTALLEPIYEKFDRVLDAVRRDTPPRCEHSLASPGAKRCAVSHLCWPEGAPA